MANWSGVFKRSSQKRRRRTQTNTGRTRKGTSGTKKRTSKQKFRSSVPVLTRYASTSSAMPKLRRGRRQRRRFDLALNAPGATIQLPSIPVVNIGWRWVSMLAAIVLLFALYYFYSSPSFRVGAAEIHGLRRMSEFTVNTALDIAGEPIFTLNPNRLEENLLEMFPEFSTAEVEVGLPNLVVITVAERHPVITWIQDNRTQLVDGNGWAFPARNDNPNNPATVVRAFNSPPIPAIIEVESILEQKEEEPEVTEQTIFGEAKPFLSDSMLSAVLTLAKRAPEKKPLVYSERHGLGWEDPRGWIAYFGDTTDIDIKLNVYEAIVAKLEYDGIRPALISVEFVHAPYYRMGE
ncbi:MAG: FtsQ-type POTRA domain-containing protein [Chloroflexota bacterium]|nr:FtsQ-type POTRA domain-containing protein [Chloroflexota bacterium]